MVFSVKRHKIVNPKRKSRKRKSAKKFSFKRKARSHNRRKKKYTKKSNRGVLTMATKNRKRRKSTSKKSHRRRRRSNPFKAHTRRHSSTSGRKRYSRRRNPGMGGGGSLVTGIIGASAGAIGTRALTQAVLGSKNTGVMGYGGNIGIGLGLAWLANKFGGKNLAYAVLLGAGVGIVQRAWSENVSLASPSSLSGARGLGDLDYSATRFGRLGDYVNTPFWNPTNSVQVPGGPPNTFMVQNPAPPPVMAAAGGGMSGHGRRFASAGRRGAYPG